MQRLIVIASIALLATACRGQESRQPPVHLIQDMDFQDKFEAQEANPFFADGRAMRPQVEGTVARDGARLDDAYYRGRENGAPVTELPVELSAELLDRGEERYNIFCAPCHDRAGRGQGTVVKRGMVPPPAFDVDRVRALSVGDIYITVSEGVRTMPSYASQIPVADRWAIVAYVRALQLSQRAGADAVPADVKTNKGWSE